MKDSKRSPIWLAIYLAALLIILGLVFVGSLLQKGQSLGSSRLEEVAKKVEKDPRIWPIFDLPPEVLAAARQKGKMPLVPEVPKGPEEILIFLFSAHPNEEIKALEEKILKGELLTMIRADVRPIAAFNWNAKQLAADGQPIDPRGVFVFTTGLFDAVSRTKQSLILVWLLLWHEYWHYNFFLEDLKDDGRLEKKDCQSIWREEHEAYWQECQLAVEWGVPELALPGDFCLHKGEEEFKQIIFAALTGMTATAEELEPECVATWAQLAGHPRPWAFEK